MIVTQVPKAPFYLLLGFSATYVILGIYLAIVAYRASSAEVWELATQLSLSAIVAAAFDREVQPEDNKEPKRGDDAVASEGTVAKEEKLVRVAGDSGKGWRFTVQEDA